MRRSTPQKHTQQFKRVLFLAIAAVGVLFLLWETSGFVLAFRQIKRAHIFPTDVSATGWSAAENAQNLDVSPSAGLASFSQNNSAYLSVTTPQEGVGSIDIPVQTTESATNTLPAVAPSTEGSSATSSLEGPIASSTPVLNGASLFQAIPVIQTPTPESQTPQENTVTSSSTSVRSSSIQKIGKLLQTLQSGMLTELIPRAQATTTDAQPADTITSVANCAVLQSTCHLLEFSGFNVAGSLTDKEFKKAELKFSFAELTKESNAQDGKLVVRYFHHGHWRTAGEIFLNQELSNATNGGYFSQTLDDVTSFDDMADVRVEFEFEPSQEGSPVQLYVDAVWIDGVYVEHVQDILSGEVHDPSDAPQNVSFDLSKTATNDTSLVLSSGEVISFPYLTSLQDSLQLRVDRAKYTSGASSSVVYLSVTNSNQQADIFSLSAAFPGGKGAVSEIAQYLRNVPSTATSSQKSDVAYYCPEGWASASSTNRQICRSTGDTYVCESLNDAKDNCIVSEVLIGVATTTNYISAWVPQPLIVPSEKNSDPEVLPSGYREAYGVRDPITIEPGQTLYFKLDLQTSDTKTRRFILSARGNTYSGEVHSLHLRDERTLGASVTKNASRFSRDDINEQLSTTTDFAADEQPQFRFKFKTQRSFVSRAADFLTGKTTTYSVRSAELRDAKGEVARLPESIVYDKNNEWTFELQKQPAGFRPGKYSLSLSMGENAASFDDQKTFYWGVLALNADHSSYEPNSTAHLSIAALDDSGDTMCDAELVLSITDPSGDTKDVPVVSGGGCGHNNITTLPDFVADYEVGGEGSYNAVLARMDANGSVVTKIVKKFVVAKKAPYVISREGPTRIYPSSAYAMKVTIGGTQGFTGSVVETLPQGFTVSDTHGAEITRDEMGVHLTWNTSVNGTAEQVFGYNFKAPEVSPYMYTIGPLVMKDETSIVFTEPESWNIASDATLIATGVAWLEGNATTNGANLNSATSYALTWNLSDDFDTTYYSHATSTNSSQLTVNVSGDYLVALTVPMERVDTNSTRTDIEADIRVNGAKVNVGTSRAFIRTINGVADSSNHLYVLLRGLHTGDYIESYVHNISTATDAITIGTQASMYVEYIGTDQTAYFGLATTTTAGTNFNTTATSTIIWYDDATFGRSDAGYTHDNTSASTTITLSTAGSYMVFINIPLEGAVTSASPKARVLINGVIANGGEFKQGYISNSTSAIDSSLHWSGVITATTSNTRVSVTTLQGAAAGTLTTANDTASIYIQQLPSSGVYFGNGTTTVNGTNWNQTPATSTKWTADTIKDSAVYTHATSTNSHQVTVLQAGDYLLALNDSHNGAVTNTNQITSILVNGVPQTGAQTKTHFIPNAGGDVNSSGSLVYLLRDLAINDVVTVTTVQSGGAGTILEDKSALFMLWHKSSQSSFVQDTERWYANMNGEPPTDPWPTGAVDLNEADSITTGNSVKSGDVLRLRMALKANVTTLAGADSFKLQYAPGNACTIALAWSDVGAIGSGSIWRGFDNAGVTAGATLSTTTLSVSSTTETYQEQNPSAVTPNGVTVGTDAEWDWTLQDNGADPGTGYCFRMVQSSGQVLKDYLDYPQLVTNSTSDTPTISSPFDNAKLASTSPILEFTSSDDNGEDLHYEVQISTDPAFGTTVVDEDSVSNFSNFSNTTNSADKAPFGSGQIIDYLPTATLSNNTTYWWRVRAKDPLGTNSWGTYSTAQSFTVDTSVTASTWFQTTQGQFLTDTLTQLSATVTNDVQTSGANTTGTVYSPEIDYSFHTTGNSWGVVSWNNTQTGGSIRYFVEYLTSTSSWAIIQDSDLPGNSAGTTTSPITLTGLDPETYAGIRIRADFIKVSTSPVLSDWTVNWALSVAQPTLINLFDNEKTATTSPTFTFSTNDPQGDRLVYQIQWSTDSNFVTGVTTRTSDTNAGFLNTASSTNTSPFVSGNTISFKVQPADVLASSTTYWWRVRAKDPSGGNAYSLWASSQSFTTDTTVLASTWFQTSTDQFNNDTLTLTGASGGSVTATSTTGNIAIYRANTGNDAITTAIFNHFWDTTVRQDSIYALYSTTSLQLKKGHYAVMYDARFRSSAGTNRSEIQSNLNLAGVAIPAGWSQAFIRRNGNATQGFSSGGGIIKVQNDNDRLMLQSFRTDTNTTAGVVRSATSTGIQLIKLDDSWSYARLSKSTKQTGPVSTGWLPVTYNREDEIDTTAYSHATGASSLVLKNPGHYLVFANTYGSLKSTNTETNVDQKLKLDNTDIDGSYTTVYMRGNANADGDYQGAATIGTIIQSTTTNQSLTVQLARSIGTAAWTINANQLGAYVDRTSLTVVKVPEADFIRLSNATSTNINPTLQTPLSWGLELEKDASFTHSTSTNTSRITATTPGDYLFLSSNYAAPGTTANAQPMQGWRKNAGTLTQYGQTGSFNILATGDTGAFTGIVFPGVVNTDFFDIIAQALGTTGTVSNLRKGVQAVRIASLTEADTNPKTVQSGDIVFTGGTGPKWSTFSWSDTRPASTNIIYQLLYLNASSTYSLVPDAVLPGNSSGFSTTSSSVNISNLNRITYGTLRTQATFTCAAGNCPTLNDWTLNWSQGINVSGTAKAYDQTTSLTNGTVAVAVNGVLQSGKTGTIAAGVWTIPNVTAFQNDIITVFISTTTAAARAVAVTKYTSTNDITGMSLNQMHVTLGSNDNPTLTNADLSLYDNSVSGNSAIFDDVSGANLSVCAVTSCSSARLLIKSGTIFEPGIAGGNVTTPNIQIDGTFIADANTITVSGSWKNNAIFTKGTSSVIFSATSTSETIDSTLATTSAAFYAVTFGQTSGAATWTLLSPLYASSTATISYGTLLNGIYPLALSGDLTIGTSGTYTHGTGTTTFMGSGTNAWTDNSASKQDMGVLIVDGVSKTIQLGSNVKATDLTIGSDDTLTVSLNNYSVTVLGNWTNNNSFLAQAGTVIFASTVTGKTITPGASPFYNLTFNGSGGNWAFTSNAVTVSNDLNITNGTVTLPTATTTIAGSLDASSGTFVHNNAAIVFTTTGSKTINPGASSFYDLVFSGSGSWNFSSTQATSSRNTIISAGSVTLPSGTLAVGGTFTNSGGSFSHNAGTIKLNNTAAQIIRFGNSSPYNLLFAGSGSWSFFDANATTTGTVSFQNGAATLPSGVLAIGGSLQTTGGTFVHNSGTVKLIATTTGFSISPNLSSFYNLTLNGASGGWTVSGNATTTNNFTLTAAASFTQSPNTTLSVGGQFTNSVGGSATTFASSTLALTSGTSYSINTKAAGGDTYGTLSISNNTNIRSWNSAAATTTVTSGSLYSQNHNAVSGALNIYGTFSSSGSEYWSYATDFDGAAIGGRQVSVRIASSSTVSFTGGSIQITGSTTATTTIQNQGVGAYGLSVSGGTLFAQYYQMSGMNNAGFSLSGTPTVTTLSSGDYTLAQTGGSMLTVAASVINQNPGLQIQQVKFATSTGVTAGSNVTEVGTPTSYWWFRNHFGNFAGENYDTDPGGNPGYIRWDDSGYNITVSGRVYSDHGVTSIGNPPCDGSTPVVTVLVGASTYTGSCNASTGAYSIGGVQFTGDVVLTTYLNTNGGKKAVTVTKTPTADISDLDLYQNALIVRQEGVTPTTISDLATFDSTKDSDIFFSASSTAATLVTQPETELYVWNNKIFTPGGTVTLQSGGSGSAVDGRLYVATNANLIAVGSPVYSIGGGMTLLSGASLTAASSTFTFTATTTNKSINSVSPVSLYNMTFSGTGGSWSFDSAASATTTVTHALSITTGTLIGTGPVAVLAGDVAGSGVIAMTGGTFQITSSGNLGSTQPWQFKNLILGDGSQSNTITKINVGTTTVTGALTIASNQTLSAGTSPWVLTGSGTPLVINGTLAPQSAAFTYNGTAATTIANASYASLTLAPSGAGSPTYTLSGGTPTIGVFTVGNGTNPVTVTADTNDPSIAFTGTFTINASATYIASNIGVFTAARSWINLGTFTNSSASVTFNATTTGNTIQPGLSSFYNLTLNGASGGWTVSGNATTTNNFTLTAAASFTQSPNTTLSVGGQFTNSVGGSATTFASSTLALTSGTSYSINTKAAGGDTYGTLSISNNTNIRSWNSAAATTTVTSGSLYSQNHNAVSGALNIYGTFSSSGSEYWSYATDFDGTDISGSPRKVNVSIASSSVLTFTSASLDITGGPSASTTVQNQGVGAYALSLSGGTLNAAYYEFRNIDSNGFSLTGAPTVTSLSNGDFQLGVSGGTMLKVAGTVIDANPLKIIKAVKFATTSGVTAGSNVTATGSAGSSWKFNLHYGNRAGEAYDVDPAGDPGYIRWDDSASQITISGRVYSDEGVTTSTVCDNTTQNVKLVVEGTTNYTSSCNSSTGAYSISNVSFNPGDTLTLYLDTNGGRRAADISVDPISNISGMDLYENRVIVRHEDTIPITIADISQYTSLGDSDIPFTTSSTTLTLPPNTKLIVWDSKTFAPGGNVVIQSGGAANSYDGSFEVRPSASFTAAGTQTHTIGGNITFDLGSTLIPANATFLLTATTTGKTITSPSTSSFYNLTFNGVGGNWAFASSSATTTNDVTITNGTLTLPIGSLIVGGSFLNTGGTVVHNNGTLLMNATAAGKSIRLGTSTLYNLTLKGSGGAWSFYDASATTSNTLTITQGTLTLPSGTLVVGGSFLNTAAFVHNAGTLKMTAATSGKNIQSGVSNFNTLLFTGIGGGWAFLDTNSTVLSDMTIATGTVTLPGGTLTLGGSFINTGAFLHASGTVSMNASAVGKSISPNLSSFYNLTLNGASGGWTVSGNATTTNNFTLTAAASFTQSPNTTLSVGGQFTNSVGGSATTFASSTLALTSGTSYSINTKAAGGDTYGTLSISNNTNIRSWNSAAATTTVTSGSLYSQNHNAVSGALNIYGTFSSSGSEYWSYATDFDGAAIGGRQVSVQIASSSSLSFTGSLNIVGGASATTTVQNQGTGSYALSVQAGTINALYYQIRNTDTNGLALSGTPAVASLSNGDFQLGLSGGTSLTIAASVIDANASLRITGISFATSSGVTSGFNVKRTGTPISSWTFAQHYGNYAGENYDSDGVDACGSIRWDDSACLFVNQSHYRWRNDDGSEGALSTQWYNTSWIYRKKIAVANPNATAYTNFPVKVVVAYDSNMKSDFSDLRFTDDSGTTTLPYYIENVAASASSTVWISVASLPSSGSANIYMYYGNAAAADASDGNSTFNFYDSFDSNNLASYSGDTGTKFNTGTSFARVGTYGLDAGTHVSEKTVNGIYRTGSQTAQGKTMRFYQYVNASQQDEPCTLFGVQSSAHNYAVCLDEYPNQAIEIAKNVTANDGSGTVLASTTATFTTGWYEVSIDWLTTNAINVSVYNANGTLFATLSTTDSTYTSGGIGFSYWFQHGGWDYYTTRPFASSTPTAVFGSAQTNYGATWAAAEDTGLVGLNTGTNIRLRFSVQNTGSPLINQNFRLQIAPKGGALNCESVPYVNYNDVPVAGSCGSAVACMTSSSQFSNLASTSGSLTYPASMGFSPGEMMQNTSNQTNGIPVSTNAATEVEYNFQMTNYATANAYCLRTSKGGIDLDSYDHVAQATILHAPTISNMSINSSADIPLTEGTTTNISMSCTVTDLNGYADMSFGTSTLYRSGVGASCGANQNNCYKQASTSCSFSSCSGNACTMTCTAPMQYLTDPTDTGSTYAAQNWLSTFAVQDSTGLRDTQTSLGVEVLTLYGLDLNTGSINFGSLAPGQNTGTTNATTTVINTGNSLINIQLLGTDLASGASSIAVGQQKFSTTTFAYGSCALCTYLSGSATNVTINIPKSSSTSTPTTGNVYWGINIPNGTGANSYSGTNTFIAVGG